MTEAVLENPDLFDLTMSEEAQPLLDAVKKHIKENVDPISDEYHRLGEGRKEHWGYGDGQLELLETAKQKAKDSGLWNFFLPDADTGEGLSNLDYAFIANELGKSPLASETLNCSAPDTGNMEVLERVGTPEQKEQWLKPLLNGEIRSAFAMTEPAVPSSDAKNVSTQAVLDGDEWVINGEKYYISGAGDPRCKIMITMVKTSPDAPAHKQQSQILVPIDAKGVNILDGMEVFGHDDAPHGHMHIHFDNVRVPKENMLLGEGRGFEISQLRLGPGRIHHCMRAIGQAEKALELMTRRSLTREAFGKPIAKLGANYDIIANARQDIEMARLLCLKAAWMMDQGDKRAAAPWISKIKVVAPLVALEVTDQAVQMYGAQGISQDTPLARQWAGLRTLRLADGPDAVHRRQVARAELRKYTQEKV